jgi:hypothetical protein
MQIIFCIVHYSIYLITNTYTESYSYSSLEIPFLHVPIPVSYWHHLLCLSRPIQLGGTSVVVSAFRRKDGRRVSVATVVLGVDI